MVCTAARSTARLTVNWPSDDPHTTAEPARVVARLVIGDGVVTTQRRPPFSDHNARVVDAATTTDASTSRIASFVAGGESLEVGQVVATRYALMVRETRPRARKFFDKL